MEGIQPATNAIGGEWLQPGKSLRLLFGSGIGEGSLEVVENAAGPALGVLRYSVFLQVPEPLVVGANPQAVVDGVPGGQESPGCYFVLCAPSVAFRDVVGNSGRDAAVGGYPDELIAIKNRIVSKRLVQLTLFKALAYSP